MTSFIDRARILVRGGDGGNGASSFHRAKYVPHGGPDGGDGGRGGHVVLVVDPSLNTLLHFRYRRELKAERGAHGQGSNRHGRRGQDLEVRVPPGTVVRTETGEILADLVRAGDRLRVARGGRGGRGNARFATATNRAPRLAEKGEPGQEHWLILELKVLADVGLVGLPNAGKSTLLGQVSAARPRTGNYPFTTLEPQLGVVRYDDGFTLVMADIPGLIEGAHQGVGLGHEFLRHIERTRVLLVVLDAAGTEGRDPMADYATLIRELELYHRRLVVLPRLVALNKVDLPAAREAVDGLVGQIQNEVEAVVAVSAATGEGIPRLLGVLRQVLERAPAAPTEGPAGAAGETRRVYRAVPKGKPFTVEKQGDAFVVQGDLVKRWVAMTDVHNEEALDYLHRRLRRVRLDEALRRAGARTGDTVQVGEHEFIFEDPEELEP